MPGEISFIELGTADSAKARTFYSSLFGWSFAPGPSSGGYMIDGVGIPAGVHGGDEGAAPYVFFRVDDIMAAAARVEALGGTATPLSDDADEEGTTRFGTFLLCRDDQGSPFGLHQPPSA